jgi:O-antigen ligase
MMQLIAIILIVPAMLWLLNLNREAEENPSRALWIPLVWMLIAGSRSVSSWFTSSDNVPLEQRYAEGTPLDAAIFAFLILCALFILNRRARGIDRFFRANRALLIFFAYCAVSMAWSESPLIAVKHYVKLCGDLLMALVVLTEADPRAALHSVLSRAALILLPLSVLLILGFPELGSSFNLSDQKMYFNGVTTQKNELGMICLILGLGALWSILSDGADHNPPGRRRRLFVQGSIILMALWLMLKADSMTSFSGFAISAMVIILVGQRWVARRASTVHWLVGGATGLAIFAVFLDTSGTLLRMLGRNPTLTGRTDIWKAVLSFHTNPLIGTGFDSFWLGSHITEVAKKIGYTGITEAHNGFLEIYINMGWIGVGLLIWMIFSAYRRGVVLLRAQPQMGRFRIAIVVANIIFNLSEAGFKNLILAWIVFLMATIDIPELSVKRPAWRFATSHSTPPQAGKMRILQ